MRKTFFPKILMLCSPYFDFIYHCMYNGQKVTFISLFIYMYIKLHGSKVKRTTQQCAHTGHHTTGCSTTPTLWTLQLTKPDGQEAEGQKSRWMDGIKLYKIVYLTKIAKSSDIFKKIIFNKNMVSSGVSVFIMLSRVL